MIEFDDGRFTIIPNKVVYNGREYETPITLSKLVYFDIMFEFLNERI